MCHVLLCLSPRDKQSAHQNRHERETTATSNHVRKPGGWLLVEMTIGESPLELAGNESRQIAYCTAAMNLDLSSRASHTLFLPVPLIYRPGIDQRYVCYTEHKGIVTFDDCPLARATAIFS